MSRMFFPDMVYVRYNFSGVAFDAQRREKLRHKRRRRNKVVVLPSAKIRRGKPVFEKN